MIVVKGQYGLVYRLWRKHGKELEGRNERDSRREEEVNEM